MLIRNCLITGGTGFLGRALTYHLLHAGAERICIYSRGEHAQAAMREQLQNNNRLRWFIGDVRDQDRLELAMHGVELVIHAAALKRIEVCAANPIEAVATNVIGTRNVILAAMRAAVPRVVVVSSDKACEPTTLYGSTKLCAEWLALGANAYGRTCFAAVRYGNVAGSTGSVIERWRKAKASGEQAVISDPEATRFWMTVQEAVDCVLGAAQEMPAHVVVPSLPAYRLGDLAYAMGLGYPLIVGLQPGEKKHERLIEGGPDSSQVRRLNLEALRVMVARV